MGLTRMSVDTQPDQYTAETSGNFNQPVAGDDADLKAWVRPVLVADDARIIADVRGLRLEPGRLDAAGFP